MTRELPDPRMWQWTNDQPDTAKWVERIAALEGEYGRLAGVRVLGQAMMSVRLVMTGGVALFLWHVMSRTPHSPFTTVLLGSFVLAFVVWTVTIWRRIGFRYVLRGGMLSALGTYGNVMWTERLENLQAIRYSRERGVVRLTLVWPDRQREMLGIPSLLNALDEPQKPSPTLASIT